MRLISFLIEGLFHLFRINRYRREEEIMIENMHVEHMKSLSEKRTNKQKRLDWLKAVAVPEIVENVKELLDMHCFFDNHKDEIREDKEQVYLEIAIHLTEPEYTIETLMNTFDEALACTFGIALSRDELQKMSEYYYDNYYNAEMQLAYHSIANEKREQIEQNMR